MSENLPVVLEAPRVELGVLRANGPAELVQHATEAANALANVIKTRGLASKIQGKEFVRCEGWTTLAAMMGATPHEVETTEKDGVFTAIVELRRLSDGAVIGRASAECGAPDELDRNGKPMWSSRPRYARRSMAQTRATAKTCRLTFSWIMVLAGYQPLPAEEVPDGGFRDTVKARPSTVTETGEFKLPGDDTKWDGHGGKPLSEVPSKTLLYARDWFQKKDAKGNAAICGAIDTEIARREEAV